jgi:hypothetical protein
VAGLAGLSEPGYSGGRAQRFEFFLAKKACLRLTCRDPQRLLDSSWLDARAKAP